MFDATLSPYGELSSSATATEQTVGETWSDPAIGQMQDESGPYVMVVGSGFLKYSVQSAYRTGVTRAGTTFYVLDVATGDVLGTPRDVGADAYAETMDNCHAVQRLPEDEERAADGPGGDRAVRPALHHQGLHRRPGRQGLEVRAQPEWRTTSKSRRRRKLYDAGAESPLFSSMATVAVGGTNQYIFVGTGSDLLPSDSVNKSYSLLVILDNGSTGTKTAEILLETTDGSGADEKVTAFPSVAGDIVFFTTTSYAPTTPCTPFSANLYAFTFIGGPAYDTNNDGSLSTGASSGGGGKKGGTADRPAPTAPRCSRPPAFAPPRRSSSISTWCSPPAARSQLFGDPGRLQQRRWPGRRAHPVLAIGAMTTLLAPGRDGR